MSPSIQETYPLSPGLALPGMRADSSWGDTITMINTGADQIGFGYAVARNSGSAQSAKSMDAIANLVAGILVRTEAYAPEQLGTLGPLPKNTLNVMRKGRLWVICENGCTVGQKALFLRGVAAGAEVKGALRSAADSTDTVDMSGRGEWMTAAAAGALAILEFDFLNPLT
jgi:hypothetical protein